MKIYESFEDMKKLKSNKNKKLHDKNENKSPAFNEKMLQIIGMLGIAFILGVCFYFVGDWEYKHIIAPELNEIRERNNENIVLEPQILNTFINDGINQNVLENDESESVNSSETVKTTHNELKAKTNFVSKTEIEFEIPKIDLSVQEFDLNGEIPQNEAKEDLKPENNPSVSITKLPSDLNVSTNEPSQTLPIIEVKSGETFSASNQTNSTNIINSKEKDSFEPTIITINNKIISGSKYSNPELELNADVEANVIKQEPSTISNLLSINNDETNSESKDTIEIESKPNIIPNAKLSASSQDNNAIQKENSPFTAANLNTSNPIFNTKVDQGSKDVEMIESNISIVENQLKTEEIKKADVIVKKETPESVNTTPKTVKPSKSLYTGNKNIASKGLNALHCAAYNLNIEAIEILMETGQFDIENRTEDGEFETALLIVCRNSESEASKEKAAEVAKVLINYGANLESLDKRNFTSLAAAVYASNFALVEVLLKSGANPNERVYITDENQTILHLAMITCKNERKIIKFLIDFNADMFAINARNMAPIHEAAFRNNVAGLRELILTRRLDKHMKSPLYEEKKFLRKYYHECIFGATPLHYTTLNNSYEAMEFLLLIQADRLFKDQRERIPRAYAEFKRNYKMKDYLDKKWDWESAMPRLGDVENLIRASEIPILSE